jgi:hypothetical protein
MAHRALQALLGAAAAIVLITGTPRVADAYIDGGGDACGSSSAGWNAPNGSSVMVRSSGGPINVIIDLIGEYYTHSMMSHGPGYNKWLSHTTMETPGIHVNIFGDDHVDLQELRTGWPGPAQVNMGAAYTFLYVNGGAASVRVHNGNSATANAASWMWDSLPYCNNISSGVCYVGVYSEEENQVFYIIGRKQNGTTYRHGYGFHQYSNDYQVARGSDTSAPGWNQHCTTFISWALAVTGNSTGMTSTTYPKNGVAISTITNNLHNSVEDQCDDGAGWFGGLFVNCGDIADQIVNCFTGYNNCDNDSASVWQNYSGPPVSVSPDRGVNKSGHTNTNSPYSASSSAVQWNQPGNSYGCWY